MSDEKDRIDIEAFKVATILACLPQHVRQPLIEDLQTINPDIGHMSMRFDDLLGANDRGIKYLIREVDYNLLTLALCNSSAELKQRFYHNLDVQSAKNLEQDITLLQLEASVELDIDAFEARLDVVAAAANLRQKGLLNVDPPGYQPAYVTEQMVKGLNFELQAACEKAMAEVLSNCMPEEAAAVLCQRLDRSQILQQMLQLDEYDTYDILSEQEIEQLLSGLQSLTDDESS